MTRLRHDFALLRQGFAEPREEGVEIAHADHVHTASGPGREAGFVFAAVFLERRELLLHLGQVPLGRAHAFGAFALGAGRGLLDHVESFGSFHAALPGGTLANNWRSALTASAWLTRCSMGCMRNFCIAGHNSMAVSMRGSLPRWYAPMLMRSR